ncbi:MAG TPA: metallopeptidase TldD-related protein [Actinomycetota bacterium]|nr:metallopeptidase TldD-related protein [Actinomycetota bacterium]
MADPLELCRAAISAASDGEAAEAFGAWTRRTQVKARAGEIESLTSAETRGVGVRVVRNGQVGYAWASDPSAEEATGLLVQAREAAEHGTADEANVLPSPGQADGIPALFREELAGFSAERKVALALDLERATTSAHPDVRRVEEVAYGDATSEIAVASTVAAGGSYRRTDCWCVVAALAERKGEVQSGFSYRLAREPGELPWQEAGEEAAERAARLLGGTKPASERVAVILDPWAAASFVGVLSSALSAEQVQKGRSLLAGLVGQEVASPGLTLIDDGRLQDGPASAPFDDEGVPTGRTPLIENGKLRGYLHNAVTARRDDTTSTGNASRPGYRGTPGVAPSNLFIEPGSDAPDALLRRADRAVYVQDVTGVHSGANPVSGEFSVGATGLRVENGELAGALREMTIASTIPELLKRIVAVGSDLRFVGGGIGVPTLLIEEMTVAGV